MSLNDQNCMFSTDVTSFVIVNRFHPELELRAITVQQIDGITDLSMQVDDENILDIKERFRVQSPAFGFTLPSDNFFTAIGEGPFQAGTCFPAVDDGYYVMVAPLPFGQHTIHFHGGTGPNLLDVTYHITVSH